MTVLVILIIVAVAVFVAMKTGKVKDANNNNIPDAIEEKVEAVKEAVAEVKEVVAKATKAQAAKKPVAKTNAKKAK
jgi:predicted GTPase